eukprot:s2461_g11.t2
MDQTNSQGIYSASLRPDAAQNEAPDLHRIWQPASLVAPEAGDDAPEVKSEVVPISTSCPQNVRRKKEGSFERPVLLGSKVAVTLWRPPLLPVSHHPTPLAVRQVGQYFLGRAIGTGAFGKVLLGRHRLTGEAAAIKVVDVDGTVAREVALHKLIRLQLIMEFASGGNLLEHGNQESEARRFFQQLIAGVEHIHAINVVHRDLKPENLLLDEHNCIKIADFGLSNRFDDNQLLSTACGSPCYAPPEMILRHRYKLQSCDLWSCGCVLFVTATRSMPFDHEDMQQLYSLITTGCYSRAGFLSSSLQELIAGLLTVDPARRFTIGAVRAHAWYCTCEADARSQVRASLAVLQSKAPAEYDKSIQECEAAYMKILESSQNLLGMLRGSR